MPIVSKKRQITLPIKQCKEAGIEPGDEYHCFVAHGKITIVKKQTGSAYGILQGIESDPNVSERESMLSTIAERK